MLFPGAARIAKVVELDSIASTFDAVDERDPHLTTWATLDQRAGRGRLGREWVSPAGKCLSATVLVHTRRMPEDALAWMPLAAGLALAEALDPLVADRAGLKWPNDVLVDGSKVAGVLCERRRSAVAVGFGVNLTLAREELPTPHATSLTLEGAEGSAPVLADAILWHMLRSLDALLPALGGEGLRAAPGNTMGPGYGDGRVGGACGGGDPHRSGARGCGSRQRPRMPRPLEWHP